jgi:hypothetical protein
MDSPTVNSQTLNEFLRRLGSCYRHSGTLYLVGGSSLILLAAKTSTFDIDIKIAVPVENQPELISCLRRISQEMGIPIEQASPDEFLPLPAGYQNRHRHIGRFGNLEVFHFDFYSVALAKLHRGNEKDFSDVRNMLRAAVIELDTLQSQFDEILPCTAAFGLHTDPDSFARNFALLKERLAL